MNPCDSTEGAAEIKHISSQTLTKAWGSLLNRGVTTIAVLEDSMKSLNVSLSGPAPPSFGSPASQAPSLSTHTPSLVHAKNLFRLCLGKSTLQVQKETFKNH